VSDTQKLTPALSTPGRDLLRREIYKGLADRAAGRIKDLDVDAILAKGKELFQKRSISNVRQFGVDGRKTLFLLLLLFAIPADDCSAQTPPPPVDEHAFERVPPTVVKRLATRFSLGAFAGRFEETLENLRELSPTSFGNVPAAYPLLLEALERDADLRARFFKNMRGLGYGGALLPQESFDRLQSVATGQLGERLPFGCGWGMTETTSTGLMVYWNVDRAGLLGLPQPGMLAKLVPAGDRYELRVKGPNVMPGYYRNPEATAAAFDPRSKATRRRCASAGSRGGASGASTKTRRPCGVSASARETESMPPRRKRRT